MHHLVCGLLGHHRSRAQAWHDGNDWRSACSRCGRTMVKGYPSGRWVADDAARSEKAA